jgi:hypothetical protein
MTEEREVPKARDQPAHFFVHVPKCGGNTFSEYLTRNFPVSTIYTAEKSIATWLAYQRERRRDGEEGNSSGEDAALELSQRHLVEMRSHDLIAENHYGWPMVEQLRGYRPVTTYLLVREPRARIASHYLHLRRIRLEETNELADEGRALYQLARDLSLADFCRLDRADVWGAVFNRQAISLSSQLVGRVIFRHLDKSAFVENLLENLEQTDFVADLADLDEFAHLVSLANGWLPPGDLGTINAGDHTASEIAELAVDVPEELVTFDQVVYDAARVKFRSLRRQVLADAAVELWRNRSELPPAPSEGERWELGCEGPLDVMNFHGREGTGPETIRWMGPATESRLFIPVRRGVPQWLSVFIAAFVDPDIFPTTTYAINGIQVTPSFVVEENCTVAIMPLDHEATTSGVVELTITAPWTSSDRERGHSSDMRQKSMALRKLRLSTRSPAP